MEKIERIIEIIRDEASMVLRPDAEINENTDLISDLHIDSLDMMLIIGDIETEYDINLENTQIHGIRTVKQIADKIDELKRASI